MCRHCADNFPKIARKLLRELGSQYLEVVLIPSRDWECARRGGKIRAVQTENPPWYQDFCGLYETSGKKKNRRFKFQTKIKRRNTIKALENLSAGRVNSIYADRLVDFMARREHARREAA